MENISKAGETTFTVQPDRGTTLCQLSHVSPHNITSHIIHWVIYHTRGDLASECLDAGGRVCCPNWSSH